MNEAVDLADVFADLNCANQSEYLRGVLELDNVHCRQVVAKTFVETLKKAPDDGEFKAVLELIVLFSRDPDPRVRVELVEQIPNIAVVCFHEGIVEDPVGEYLLPVLITALTDTIPEVRETAQAALLVLLEHSYLRPDDIERKIWPIIAELSLPDNLDDLRCEAVALMTKMAPLVGGEVTEQLILDRFIELSGDSLFNVRKTCAGNFAKLCEVLPQHVVEKKLLEKFYFLCTDETWGVRKACAESASEISRLISREERTSELTNVFHQLLTDTSRWVRIAAFHHLGQFISTFADPQLTGLLLNNGSISRTSDFCDKVEPCHECPAVIAIRSRQRQPSGGHSFSYLGKHDSGLVSGVSTVSPISSNIGVSEDASGGKTLHIHVDNVESYNSFNYWRSPVPELDMDVDIVEGKPRAIHVSARVTDSLSNRVYTSQLEVGLNEETSAATTAEDVQEASNPPPTSSETSINNPSVPTTPDLLSSTVISKKLSISSDSSQQNPLVTSLRVHSSSTSSVSDIMGISNTGHIPYVQDPCTESGFSAGFGRVRLSSSSSVSESVASLSQRDHSGAGNLAALSKECKQIALPRPLFLSFLNMVDSELAQTVDTEITRHCAFSFMAVAFTLGPKHWLCLKNLYETLAQDMHWKTRRSLAFSLHELATVVGDEATCRDLVPIFYELAQDVDEVKEGLVFCLTSFARHLNQHLLHELLERLGSLLTMENERNWRYRVDLASELSTFISLLSVKDTLEYIFPKLLSLLVDKVSEVRAASFQLVGSLLKKLSVVEANDSTTDSSYNEEAVVDCLREIVLRMGESSSWVHRQTFVRLVVYLVTHKHIMEELCSSILLPTVMKIGREKISNLRLTVARGLTELLVPESYFLRRDNPWYDDLQFLTEKLRTDLDPDVRELLKCPEITS